MASLLILDRSTCCSYPALFVSVLKTSVRICFYRVMGMGIRKALMGMGGGMGMSTAPTRTENQEKVSMMNANILSELIAVRVGAVWASKKLITRKMFKLRL